MQRSIAGTALFALGATLVTGFSSWVAYQRVRDAFEREFARRLESVARTAASQIGSADVAEVRDFGQEADRYGNLVELFLSLRQAGGVANVSLIDTNGVVLADAAAPRLEGRRSPLASLAAGALAAARRGRSATSGAYRAGGVLSERRAAFSPVGGGQGEPHTVALVAVEGDVDYAASLNALGRSLALVAIMGVGALALFGTLFVRLSLSAAQLERRLSRAQNLAAMGQMTATLAHEIRNPLSIIRNAATRLGRLDPEARKMADFVVEETDRLNLTLNRYLDFARGRDETAGAGLGDARTTLRATLDLLEGEMRMRRVSLERSEVGEGPAPVKLENEALKQVYLNLILNALDAMPEGGVLRVTLGERRGRFEIALADTGMGIAPQALPRVGEPFFTTKARGSGLGLVLTRRLLRSAGGDLRIESQAGRGTICTVVLPRRGG